MLQNWRRIATLCVVVFLLLRGNAAGQLLTVEVDLDDLETWIVNHTTEDIPLGLYQLASPSEKLDPVNWRSIHDVIRANPTLVSSTLGPGALSFTEFVARPRTMFEVNFPDVGIWRPGTRWSIGFPFGRSPETFDPATFDGRFEYAGYGPPAVVAPIVFVIPEPAAGVLVALGAICGWMLHLRRRF